MQTYITKCVEDVLYDIDRTPAKRANMEILLASYERGVEQTAGTGRLGIPMHILSLGIIEAVYGIKNPPPALNYYRLVGALGKKLDFKVPREDLNDLLFLNLLASEVRQRYKPMQAPKRAVNSSGKARKIAAEKPNLQSVS